MKLFLYLLQILYNKSQRMFPSKTASDNNSISDSSSLAPSQSSLNITSLRPDCLNNLRFPSQSTSQKTHLLAFMSEFMEEKQAIKTQQIDEFCCFDRMRRLIQKNKMNGDYGSQQQDKIQKQNLSRVIQIQAKINKIENNLMKETKKNTQNVEKKVKETKQHFFGRQQAVEKVKRQGYRRYIEWHKKNKNSSTNDIKIFIEEIIEDKVATILEERDTQYQKTLLSNKALERKLLEKNLQIETLKSREINLKKKIEDLEIYREICSENSKMKNMDNEAIVEEFGNTFPGMTVSDVNKQLQKITDKCLERFNDVECKNLDKWNQEKIIFRSTIQRMEKFISKLQKNQNQLLINLKNMRYQQNLANAEMDSLTKSKLQLQNIQKKILALYNEWYGSRTESEKGLLKNLGLLQTHYQYEDMLEYIVQFDKKFSTDSKVNEYLIKVLRGIQRIRKILFPKQNNEKLDPFYILQKVEKYIKMRVYQNKKMSPLNHKKSMTFEEEYFQLECE